MSLSSTSAAWSETKATFQLWQQFQNDTTREYSIANQTPEVVSCIMFQVGVIPDKNDESGEKEVWACRHAENRLVYSLDELPTEFYEQHEIVSGVTKLTITYMDDGPIFEYDDGSEVENGPPVKTSLAPSTQTSKSLTPSALPTAPENLSTPPSTSRSSVPTAAESPTPTRESDASFTFTDQGVPSASPTETRFPLNETVDDDLILDNNFTLFPTNDFANETDDAFDFNSNSNDMSTYDAGDDLDFSLFPTDIPMTESESEESHRPDGTLPRNERGVDGIAISDRGRNDRMDKQPEDKTDAMLPPTEPGVIV